MGRIIDSLTGGAALNDSDAISDRQAVAPAVRRRLYQSCLDESPWLRWRPS
jgi:hypothetical protein